MVVLGTSWGPWESWAPWYPKTNIEAKNPIQQLKKTTQQLKYLLLLQKNR